MRPKKGPRFDIFLFFITVLSAFLNTFNIWKDQSANGYYTAAVTSMLQSFHNFFYASFDPAGFVTVDKPPVVFWIQTIFAFIFGVHGWSVILPQALAGMGSVLLIYRLTKPTFGILAARFASLVMACSPIAVAVSRTNNIDSLLVFTLLLATSLLFSGIRKGKVFYILGAFALIGVGFNMKMLQAYMVVPAFFVFYLLGFKSEWKKKLVVLATASLIMAGISVSWAVVVDSIPKDSRPYIGSSQTNSVLELAFGYNGVSRLTGMNHGDNTGGAPHSDQPQIEQEANNSAAQPNTNQDGQGQQMPGGGGPGGGSGAFGTGQSGPLRLFQKELSGQISWLLPFVFFASIGLLAGVRLRRPLTHKQQETIFWLSWLLPVAVFFSIAGFFHHYYLIMLAPPIAAITGAGWIELTEQFRSKDGWKRWLLPLAVLTTTAFELYILQNFITQIGKAWSIGIGVAGIGGTVALLWAAKNEKLWPKLAVTSLLVLLVAPVYWAATPIIYGGNSMLPQAGPSRAGFGQGPGGPPGGGPVTNSVTQHTDTQGNSQRPGMGGGPNSNVSEKLLDYVTKHNTGEQILFATTNAGAAQQYIIQTGKTVIAMGGFSGSDPILTVDKVKQMVKDKEVKFFLIPSSSSFGGPGGPNGSNEVMEWIRANGTEVPKSEWQSSNTMDDLSGGPMGRGEGNALYEIKSVS